MSRIGLMGDNSVGFVNTLLDIWNNGDCAVLFDWKMPIGVLEEMFYSTGIEKCYIDSRLFRGTDFQNVTINIVTYNGSDALISPLPREIYGKYKDDYSNNEAVIIFSSGTTGKSKGVILSHYAISNNADAIAEYMDIGERDCIYIVKSLIHSSTVVGELLVALKRKVKMLLGTTMVPHRYVLRNIEKFSVSHICLNPKLLSMYSVEARLNDYNLTSLKSIYVSGSLLDQNLYCEASSIFSFSGIYNMYGLTEAGPRVSSQTDICKKGNSVGYPIRDVKIMIVNEMGVAVDQGVCGIIHVDTPNKYIGYVEGTEKHSSLYLDWLNTGDIGYFDKDGELFVVGRVDDVINIDSHKIYPGSIEEVVMKHPDVLECSVVALAIQDKTVIGCLYVTQTNRILPLRDFLSSQLLPYEMPRVFKLCEELPRNNGKIMVEKVKKILVE